MLPHQLDMLFQTAKEAMERAIAPYSGFKVGASIMTNVGKIYTGCNIENPSLMLSICAERTAIIKALSEGERRFSAIAIVSNKGEYCYPCGACRQVIIEFAPFMDIYLISNAGIKKFSISELLPESFRYSY